MPNVPENDKDPTPSALPETQKRSTEAVPAAQQRPTDAPPPTPQRPTGALPIAPQRPTDVPPAAQRRPTDAPPTAPQRPTQAPPEAPKRPTNVVPETQKRAADSTLGTQKRSTDAASKVQKQPPKAASTAQKLSTSATTDTHTTPTSKDQIAPVDTAPPSERVTLSRRLRIYFAVKKLRETWVPTLAFFVIVIQSFILLQQKEIMNRQSETMSQQSTLMDSQTRLMEKSFRVSERAYVGVAKVTVTLENREILILLHNIGHVPAGTVTVQGQQIRTTAEKKDPKGTVFRWDAGEVELFPGTEMPVVVSLEPFEQSEVDAIKNRKELLFIGGTIHYNDGFGNSEKTTFAFQYDPPDRWIAHSDLSKMFKEIAR